MCDQFGVRFINILLCRLEMDDLFACMRVCRLWYGASRDANLWKALVHRDCLCDVNQSLSPAIGAAQNLYVDSRNDAYERYRSYATNEHASVAPSVAHSSARVNSSLVSHAYNGEVDKLQSYFAPPSNAGNLLKFWAYMDAWVYYGNFSSSSEDGYIVLARNGDGAPYFTIVGVENWDDYALDEDSQQNEDEQCKGTLLHWACLQGRVECARYLLTMAPELLHMKMPGSGYTAMDIAKVNHHASLVSLLRKWQ
jgi:hypothetical protein